MDRLFCAVWFPTARRRIGLFDTRDAGFRSVVLLVLVKMVLFRDLNKASVGRQHVGLDFLPYVSILHTRPVAMWRERRSSAPLAFQAYFASQFLLSVRIFHFLECVGDLPL